MHSVNFNFAADTYEKILSGEIKSFSPYFFEQRYRKKRVIQLVKYLVEDKLKISPESALEKVDLKLLKKYKLDALLKYVDKPIELDKNDVSHLIHYAYKGELESPTQRDLTIKMYKKILDGTMKNFPKNYFVEGKLGEDRVRYCLEYLCEEVLNLDSSQMFDVITIDVLKDYKLRIVLNVLYVSMYDLFISTFPEHETIIKKKFVELS